MRRLPTLCLLALAPLTGVAPQAQAASLYNLLVGTYTEGSSEGIQVYRFDGADGSVKGPLRVAHTSNPSYLTFAPDQRTLFVVNENGRGGKGDTVGRATSYRFDPISGRLQQISQVQTLADHPTYSSLSHDGRYLFVANYSVQPEGSVAVLPVRADGSLAPVVQVESHQASKVHPRQVSGHVHSVVSSPDGQYLFAPTSAPTRYSSTATPGTGRTSAAGGRSGIRPDPARQRPAPSDLQRRRAFRLPDPGTERPGDGVRP